MKTIIAPSNANSTMVNGLFLMDGKFVNRYKEVVSEKWAQFLVWSKQNTLYGEVVANHCLDMFLAEHNMKNQLFNAI